MRISKRKVYSRYTKNDIAAIEKLAEQIKDNVVVPRERKFPLVSRFVEETCKIGQQQCCRYLGASAGGIVCLKLDPILKVEIDQRVATMRAQGDNCPGKPFFPPLDPN